MYSSSAILLNMRPKQIMVMKSRLHVARAKKILQKLKIGIHEVTTAIHEPLNWYLGHLSSSFNMADAVEETPSKRKRKETTPGVVYMSRLPPFMKPAKIRNIFSQYGEVGRLFLQPEGENCVKYS